MSDLSLPSVRGAAVRVRGDRARGRRIRILGATAHPTASWVAQAASDLADGLDQAQVVVADDEPDPGQTAFAQVTHGAGDCRFAANPVAALRGERGERWTVPPLSHSILKSGGNSRSSTQDLDL